MEQCSFTPGSTHDAGLVALCLSSALGVLPVEVFEEVVLDRAQRLAMGPARACAVAKDLLNRAAGLAQRGRPRHPAFRTILRS
jgi:hypothetical protein